MNSGTDNRQDSIDIYSILREDIIGLRLQPGFFFSIKDICEKYDSGRTPTRDALIRLAQEGLITFLPQRGTMVSRLDLQRIENERFIRRSIEENVMREFVGIYSPSVLLHLEEIIQRQKACIEKHDIRGFFAEDEEFHYRFYEETGREYCWDVIQKECCNYKRLRLLTLILEEESTPDKPRTENGRRGGRKQTLAEEQRDGMNALVRQHDAILNAIRQRDLEEVLRRFDDHMNRIGTQERQLRNKLPDLFGDGSGQDKRENSGLDRDFLLDLRSRGL